jgi:hypothetical protein
MLKTGSVAGHSIKNSKLSFLIFLNYFAQEDPRRGFLVNSRAVFVLSAIFLIYCKEICSFLRYC